MNSEFLSSLSVRAKAEGGGARSRSSEASGGRSRSSRSVEDRRRPLVERCGGRERQVGRVKGWSSRSEAIGCCHRVPEVGRGVASDVAARGRRRRKPREGDGGEGGRERERKERKTTYNPTTTYIHHKSLCSLYFFHFASVFPINQLIYCCFSSLQFQPYATYRGLERVKHPNTLLICCIRDRIL